MAFTRTRAARDARKTSLTTSIKGIERIGNTPHQFWVQISREPTSTRGQELIATFGSPMYRGEYSFPITPRQLLNFIRRHYPRKVSE